MFEFLFVKKNLDGITAAVIHRGKILLIKRINLPFVMVNPGVWNFVQGAREKGERYVQTAFREVNEETGISSEKLHLAFNPSTIRLFDYRLGRKSRTWENKFFVFYADSKEVKLDLENTAFRWASIKEIESGLNYTNIFFNHESILNRLRRALDGEKKHSRSKIN